MDLNIQIRRLVAERRFKNAEEFLSTTPHIRGLSYFQSRQDLSDAEKAIDDLMTVYRAGPLALFATAASHSRCRRTA